MRRFLMFILVVAILGGGGYYGYNHFYKKPLQTAAAEPKKKDDEDLQAKETKKVKEKDIEDVQRDISTDKVWEYSFDYELDASTVNNSTITVKDIEGNKVPVQINLINQGKTIQISPPSGGYKKGTIYKLKVKNGGIAYTDGKKVSKHFESNFITKRDEVVKATVNKNLIKVNENQFEVVGENTLKINKSVKKDLKKGDIVVIPTDKNPVGEALKVKTIDSNIKSFTIEVEKPSFPELFEKLDIYKDYTIKPENVTLEPGLEGTVTLNPVAQVEPNTQVASSLELTKKGEFSTEDGKGKGEVKIGVSSSKGLEFGIKGLTLGKESTGVTLDGSINIFQPKIHPDIKLGERFILTSNLHTEEKVSVTRKGFKKEDVTKLVGDIKVNDNKLLKDTKFANKIKENPLVLNKSIKLAEVKVPIPEVPGLLITGAIYMNFSYDVNGKQIITLTVDSDSEQGIIYEKGHKPRVISTFQPQVNVAHQGIAHAEAHLGPKVAMRLSMLEVIGVGLDGVLAGKTSGDFSAGMSLQNHLIFCANASVSGEFTPSVFLDEGIINTKKSGNYLVQFKGSSLEFAKKSFNTCTTFDSIVANRTRVFVEPEKQVDVKISEKQIDLLKQKYSNKDIKINNLKATTKDRDVLKITKTKDGIKVTALKLPKKETTDIVLTYKKDDELFRKDKVSTLTIPVKITSYDKVKKELEVEKKKKEQEASKSLNGTWSRNIRNSEGTLNISNATGEAFDFTLETYFGANIGGAEGKAKISGTKATFVDPDVGCKLTFNLGKDAINIDESDECSQLGGIGTTLAGKYDKGAAKVVNKSFSELGVLTAKDDAKVKKLVGKDYDTLVKNMQVINTDVNDEDNMDSTIITGGVTGLYTFKEGIVQFDKKGYYYVGLIVDDSKVRFYSNNPSFKNTMTFTELLWMSRFNDYPVETIYKDI